MLNIKPINGDEFHVINILEEMLSAPQDAPGFTDDSWAGGSLKETQKIARDGWLEGVAHVRRFASQVEEKIGMQNVEQFPVMDVMGSSIDMGAFMEGVPECMIRFEDQHTTTKGKVYKILVDGIADWSVDNDTIIRRGAAVYVVADMMIKAGLDVEIWLCYSLGSQDRTYGHNTFIKIKSSDQTIPPAKLAFMLIHPGMLRKILSSYIRYHESWTKWNAKFQIRESFRFRPMRKEYIESFDIYTGQLTRRGDARYFETEYATVKWINEQCKGITAGV
jgi:hypothetical protein